MHAAIEKVSEHTQIYWPNDWINIIMLAKKGGNPYSVERLTVEDFIDFNKAYSKDVFINKRMSEDLTTLKWTEVPCLKFKKSETNSFFFKMNFWDQYREINVKRLPSESLRRPRKTSSRTSSNCSTSQNERIEDGVAPKPAYKMKIAIKTVKYKDLQDLCKSRIIPEEYHSFYSSLTHTTAQGTAEDNEDEELTLMRTKIKSKKRKATSNK